MSLSPVAIFTLVFILIGCDGPHMPLPKTDSNGELTEDYGNKVVFQQVEDIFEQRCSMCHNGTGLADWTDYESAKNKKTIIKSLVYESVKMPPSNVTNMTEQERKLVAQWVDDGGLIAPPSPSPDSEGASDPLPPPPLEIAEGNSSGQPQKEPTPGVDPGSASDADADADANSKPDQVTSDENEIFAEGSVAFSFKEDILPIFENRCAMCHNASIASERQPNVLDVEVVTEADALKRLFSAVVKTKRMPVGNITNMTDAEREIVAQWIKSGAPK